ncbi:MAG: VOC family protein [Ilumatobacteraceae bacterium]
MTTITPARTAHVGINVVDLERSTDFYATALGLEPGAPGEHDGSRFAFLTAGGKPVVTLWEQSTGEFATDRPGLHHLAFEVDDAEALHAARERIARLGARFAHDGVVAHREGASSGGVFFFDPDGTRLEIYAPNGDHEVGAAPHGDAPTCGFF